MNHTTAGTITTPYLAAATAFTFVIAKQQPAANDERDDPGNDQGLDRCGVVDASHEKCDRPWVVVVPDPPRLVHQPDHRNQQEEPVHQPAAERFVIDGHRAGRGRWRKHKEADHQGPDGQQTKKHRRKDQPLEPEGGLGRPRRRGRAAHQYWCPMKRPAPNPTGAISQNSGSNRSRNGNLPGPGRGSYGLPFRALSMATRRSTVDNSQSATTRPNAASETAVQPSNPKKWTQASTPSQ